MLLERQLNDPDDMNYNQEKQPDVVDVLQKNLEEESGKLKALEQYANSLRLLRVKQTEQHARLEDKVRQLERTNTVTQQELKEKALKIEALSNHQIKGQMTELHCRVQELEEENNTLKDNLAELHILRKQLSEINAVTIQTEQEKHNALEQVSVLSGQVEELKQMAQECSDLVDAEQNEQAQTANQELGKIQAELNKIRAQASEDIKAMREQMQQSTDDTTRLITEMEQEKQRITELELMTRPLSLTNNEQRPEPASLQSSKNRLKEQKETSVEDQFPQHLAANGLVTTILVSILCAMVLAILLLFTTEGGRHFLASYLKSPQEQIMKIDDLLSLLGTESH